MTQKVKVVLTNVYLFVASFTQLHTVKWLDDYELERMWRIDGEEINAQE
jgi:hypothetical protein